MSLSEVLESSSLSWKKALSWTRRRNFSTSCLTENSSSFLDIGTKFNPLLRTDFSASESERFSGTTHNPQFLDSLRRRANARSVSFRISLRWLTYIVKSVYSLISDVCLTIYDFLTRVNSSRTRCYLLNCTWLQVWAVTTTCRYFLRAECFFSTSPRLLPFLFPAAAGTSCGQSCFYGLRDCEDCPALVDAILFHRSKTRKRWTTFG